MGFRLKSGSWKTIDNHNVQNLVVSNSDIISPPHGGESNSNHRLLMGRYQVEVSNFIGISHDPSLEDDL